MATGNFYYKNASKVFAIGLDYKNEDGENVSCESWEYNETLEYIREQLELNEGVFCFSAGDVKSAFDNRNFNARGIGSLTIEKYFGDVCVGITVNCFSRCGYYEGACLDWETEVYVNSTSDDDIACVSEIFEGESYHSDMNIGMLKIQAKNAQKWANKAHSNMVGIIENVFENCSATFNKVATFSNGETIYEKC